MPRDIMTVLFESDDLVVLHIPAGGSDNVVIPFTPLMQGKWRQEGFAQRVPVDAGVSAI